MIRDYVRSRGGVQADESLPADVMAGPSRNTAPTAPQRKPALVDRVSDFLLGDGQTDEGVSGRGMAERPTPPQQRTEFIDLGDSFLQKAAEQRWNELVDGGMDPDEATERVLLEFER
jgi:hypothetical protein